MVITVKIYVNTLIILLYITKNMKNKFRTFPETAKKTSTQHALAFSYDITVDLSFSQFSIKH